MIVSGFSQLARPATTLGETSFALTDAIAAATQTLWAQRLPVSVIRVSSMQA